jgi:hypothetical protein
MTSTDQSTAPTCTPVAFLLDPETLTIDDLAPGVPQHRDVQVDNLGTSSVQVHAQVVATEGDLFTGTAPVQVQVAGDGQVAAGTSTTVGVQVLLPAEATSGYQGASGTATVRVSLTTTCDDGSGSGALATTGTAGVALLLTTALALVAGGHLMRRRTRGHARDRA